MTIKENYDKTMEKEIASFPEAFGENKPKLLLHSCCGPCSTAVLERLASYFHITLLYYNPNIYPEDEYLLRLKTQIEVINKCGYDISLLEGEYIHEEYLAFIKGLEEEKEGGKRCEACFKLRLEKTAELAKRESFDYFTTTLTVSPHKNSPLINAIGKEISQKYGVKYLFSDFKKKEGYKRSTQLSKEYGIYRQNYCGCEFSMWFKEEQ